MALSRNSPKKRPDWLTRLLFFFLGRGKLWRSALWALIGMACGILALAYITAGEIYDYTDSVDGVHLPEVDAIVVLAGGRGRIAAAADIWYRYWELSQVPLEGAGRDPAPRKPPILFVSGMGHQSTWRVLAYQVRPGVLTALKQENVILETKSENTEENAKLFARFAKEREWDSILLITSRYHMRRAKHIFEQVLDRLDIPMRIETLSLYQEPFEPDEWRSGLHGVRVTMLEYLKWIYYRRLWKPDAEGAEPR